MIMQKRIGLLVTCLAVCLNVQAFGQEPNEISFTLNFELAPPQNDPNIDETYGVFVAEMRSNRSWFFPTTDAHRQDGRRFLSYLKKTETLTELQRSRIYTQPGFSPNRLSRYSTVHEESDQIQKLTIHAMTERDAKVIAQIFMDYAMREYQETTGRWKAQSESRSRTISVLKKTIAELEQELPESDEEFVRLKTEVLYRSPQEAEQAIHELNRILTIAQVDIAGIRSAIEAVQDFQQSPRNRSKLEIIKTLEQILVEHTISLKAAQARESTAQGLRLQAIRYVELEEYVREGPGKLRQARKDLNANETSLAKINEDINSLIKPEVIDNKVTIYKITEKPEN